MYENNNNGYQPYQQPQYNFSTDQQPQSPLPPQPPKKKKNHSGLVAGVIVAAMILGGASGFGGAYLASRVESQTSDNAAVTTTAGTSSDEPEETDSTTTTAAAENDGPAVSVSDDLATLENMATVNTTVEYSYEELFEKVNESIVVVSNYVSDGSGYTLYGMGSGVIFTTDGYIVTNAHVVSGAAKVSVTVSDSYSSSEEFEATVLGSDSATDIAVLKITRNDPFTAAAIGDSDTLKIGQEVCVIGNPASLEKTLTNGIVSGLYRYSTSSDGSAYELSSIQTNAAINSGNSGGGLFDMYGNLVGVVNSKLVSSSSSNTIEGLGFAITINEAKPVISDLINYGYVTGRPILGITTMQITQYTAQLYGLSATGLLVTDINDDAPAAQSGLQIGDVITAVNGTAVSSVSDVQSITKGMSAGDTVTVTVSRTSSNGNSPFGGSQAATLDIVVELTESKG